MLQSLFVVPLIPAASLRHKHVLSSRDRARTSGSTVLHYRTAEAALKPRRQRLGASVARVPAWSAKLPPLLDLPKPKSRKTADVMAFTDFDSIFDHIGGFGRYQMMLFWINCLMNTFLVFVYFGQFFMTLTPPHWCAPPPDLAGLNLTSDQVKSLTIPRDPHTAEVPGVRQYHPGDTLSSKYRTIMANVPIMIFLTVCHVVLLPWLAVALGPMEGSSPSPSYLPQSCRVSLLYVMYLYRFVSLGSYIIISHSLSTVFLFFFLLSPSLALSLSHLRLSDPLLRGQHRRHAICSLSISLSLTHLLESHTSLLRSLFPLSLTSSIFPISIC
ncbi:glucose transporter 1 [Penaeus vannamei]|uniref:Glucose transporter 1 n=1 Tax=Penaeus vannamei TaxID=6689 RepID=A0A3R7MRP2_PENVA|nr:glucose transporter 1 [Penaeus vannamei]